MFSVMLKSKLHKLTVTQSEPDYEGSLAIDADLLSIVKILPYEKILVSNLANGNRFETYAVPARAGSGTVCLMGPASSQGAVGDRIIVFAFGTVSEEELPHHKPLILVLGKDNKPVGGLKEV
jgi:aspartate 1-decarboxylase